MHADSPDLFVAQLYGDAQPSARSSEDTFPGGGLWRIEIASVEGAEALAAVIDEAHQRDVPVHRVSQGSGVMMLSDAEISEMVGLGRENDIEVCLFLGPRGNWDIGAQRFTPSAGATRVRGRDGVVASIHEAERAIGLGVRSLLVGDEGVLWALAQRRAEGLLPPDLQFKVSVMIAPHNPASFALLHGLGADTVNVPSDLTLAQLAEFRAASAATMDFYVEAPDNVGGFVRTYDGPEIVRVAAPVYLKFGLRNAPDIYPSGGHLQSAVIATARERVRRAGLACEHLARFNTGASTMATTSNRDQPAHTLPLLSHRTERRE